MATQTDIAEESQGAMLARMLAGHRTFLENVYSLMRFLEAEVTKHAWTLVKPGGYGVTRNGKASGLATFRDWAISQAGIAFIRADRADVAEGITTTQIPAEGLEVLVFQVRWLDKAPGEPVVWHAHLVVEPEGSTKPRKWEDYQTMVFSRLEPEGRPGEEGAGNIRSGRVPLSGTAIVFTGRFQEVPVTAIQTEEDVISQLIEPALVD